jgi:hypothetical protein
MLFGLEPQLFQVDAFEASVSFVISTAMLFSLLSSSGVGF